MRKAVVTAGIGTLALLLAAPLSGGNSALASSTIASWEMNEPQGATVMTDSSGNGLHGVILPSPEITTGVTFNGATGYRWIRKVPNTPPAAPAHVIQVPDNPLLDVSDPSVTQTVEIRYRTKEKFGNIIQKGQATTKGGQFKVQNPVGRPSCLFKGSIRRVATRSTVALNDNNWHVLTCVRTQTRVTLLVDGVVNNWQNGSTGAINNNWPVAIGGKTQCDQIRVTCDYFAGDIDWVRITNG